MGAMPVIETFGTPWIPYALALSLLFIAGFWFVGTTVQKFGIGLATLMQKMSLIISVTFMLLIFGESLHPVKILGIALAILSILLYNHNALRSRGKRNVLFLLPLMTWLISGVIEILLFLGQAEGKVGEEYASFVTMIFLGAGVAGLLVHLPNSGPEKLIRKRNILAGIALGIPNFFSMYFLVWVLNLGWEGSIVFPINNIGVLLFSSLVAMLAFSENIGFVRWIGLFIAAASIALLTTFA